MPQPTRSKSKNNDSFNNTVTADFNVPLILHVMSSWP